MTNSVIDALTRTLNMEHLTGIKAIYISCEDGTDAVAEVVFHKGFGPDSESSAVRPSVERYLITATRIDHTH